MGLGRGYWQDTSLTTAEKVSAEAEKSKLFSLGINGRYPWVEGDYRYLDMYRVAVISLLLTLAGQVAASDQSLLLAAVGQGRERTVQDLLGQGADANARNPAGRPALVLAAFNGNTRTLRALLAAGADVNAVDEAGNSALMEAAAFGHLAVVSNLVLGGADVNLKNKAGVTALGRAMLGKHQSVINLLQDAGASEEGDDG